MFIEKIQQFNKTSNDPQFWFNKMGRQGMNAFSRLLCMMFALLLANSAIQQESLVFDPASKTTGYILLFAVCAIFGYFIRSVYLWHKCKEWKKWFTKE